MTPISTPNLTNAATWRKEGLISQSYGGGSNTVPLPFTTVSYPLLYGPLQ